MTSDKKVSAWGTYCPGVVGEARDEDVDSANSQFFLMRQPYPSLDKRYTAFGRVLVGLDVVRAIKTGEPVAAPQDRMVKVRLLADIPPAHWLRIAVPPAFGWSTPPAPGSRPRSPANGRRGGPTSRSATSIWRSMSASHEAGPWRLIRVRDATARFPPRGKRARSLATPPILKG